MVMRLKTGVHGLDILMGGGYLPNTVNIVLGTTGVGKTLFGLQYIFKGLEEGTKGLFVSFDMDEKQIIKTANNMGWEIEYHIENGNLLVRNFVVDDITYLNSDLLEFILHNADKNARIVIDSFTPLIASLNYTMRKDVNWFFQKLREVGTSVVTIEEPLFGNTSIPSVTIPAFLGDSVIHLKKFGYGELFDKTLTILKHRNSWHAEGVFPYKIFKGFGIIVDSSVYEEIGEKRLTLNEVLERLDVSPECLTPKILKGIKLALSEGKYKREELIDFISRVVECYQE